MSDLSNRLRAEWEPGGDIYEAADLIERQEREIKDRDRVEYALRKEVEVFSEMLEALKKMKEFYEKLSMAKVKVPGDLWVSGAAAIAMADNAIAKVADKNG